MLAVAIWPGPAEDTWSGVDQSRSREGKKEERGREESRGEETPDIGERASEVIIVTVAHALGPLSVVISLRWLAASAGWHSSIRLSLLQLTQEHTSMYSHLIHRSLFCLSGPMGFSSFFRHRTRHRCHSCPSRPAGPGPGPRRLNPAQSPVLFPPGSRTRFPKLRKEQEKKKRKKHQTETKASWMIDTRVLTQHTGGISQHFDLKRSEIYIR